MLSAGDLSIVGEKGVSLTTGQKAKICLARSVFLIDGNKCSQICQE